MPSSPTASPRICWSIGSIPVGMTERTCGIARSYATTGGGEMAVVNVSRNSMAL